MMLRLLRLVLVAGCLIVALSACVYKMDIAQGNRIPPQVLAQLKLGMTRNQVKFLLGTPAVQDPYQPDQWYYIYYLKDDNGDQTVLRDMTLSFTDDVLTGIDGTLNPG
jgi:outer membrane protein assembly factor BamE